MSQPDYSQYSYQRDNLSYNGQMPSPPSYQSPLKSSRSMACPHHMPQMNHQPSANPYQQNNMSSQLKRAPSMACPVHMPTPLPTANPYAQNLMPQKQSSYGRCDIHKAPMQFPMPFSKHSGECGPYAEQYSSMPKHSCMTHSPHNHNKCNKCQQPMSPLGYRTSSPLSPPVYNYNNPSNHHHHHLPPLPQSGPTQRPPQYTPPLNQTYSSPHMTYSQMQQQNSEPQRVYAQEYPPTRQQMQSPAMHRPNTQRCIFPVNRTKSVPHAQYMYQTDSNAPSQRSSYEEQPNMSPPQHRQGSQQNGQQRQCSPLRKQPCMAYPQIPLKQQNPCPTYGSN